MPSLREPSCWGVKWLFEILYPVLNVVITESFVHLIDWLVHFVINLVYSDKLNNERDRLMGKTLGLGVYY